MLKLNLKWIIYILVLLGLVFTVFQQFFVEQYMRMYLRNTNFVISLTTTPHRIDKISPTIESILSQNLKPTNIYLSIPYLFKRDNLEYIIPQWLIDEPRITIIRSNDYGPATKLLGVIEQMELDPNTIIITLDDDTEYPENTALHLVYKSKNNPKHTYCIAGVNLEYNLEGLVSSEVKEGISPIYNANQNVSIVRGFGGVAYRRSFFDDTIFDVLSAPEECINSDDLYISFYLAKKNIERKILKNKFIDRFKINIETSISRGPTALHVIENGPVTKHRACVQFMRARDPYVVF